MSVSPISTIDTGNLQANYTADSSQWDTAPTQNSTKPITSDGVFKALQAKAICVPFGNETALTTWTTIPFGTPTLNLGGAFTVSNSGNISCMYSGTILIMGCIAPASSGTITFALTVNGNVLYNKNLTLSEGTFLHLPTFIAPINVNGSIGLTAISNNYTLSNQSGQVFSICYL